MLAEMNERAREVDYRLLGAKRLQFLFNRLYVYIYLIKAGFDYLQTVCSFALKILCLLRFRKSGYESTLDISRAKVLRKSH